MDHVPILPGEIADALLADVHDTYVDATFGRGGHSRVLLDRLAADARLVVVDQDPEAVAHARLLAQQDPRVLVAPGRFADIQELLGSNGIDQVAGVLMDLGVSSPQLDDPQRGFSFRFDAPLDMRMNPETGPSARDWLAVADEHELKTVFRDYGEERFAGRIARAIVTQRTEEPIQTTTQLAALVVDAQPRPDPHKHGATRVFQAIRIHINAEMDQLREGLEGAFESLVPGGRLAVLSFHSVEDRIVKRRFRTWIKGEPLPRRLPVTGEQTGRAVSVVRSQTADAAEVAQNPRARSARLRVIEKVA